MIKLTCTYFYGNQASAYGIENGYLDYATLAKAFNCVMNNSIFSTGWNFGEWEQESGWIDNQEKIDELQDQIDELQEMIDGEEYESTPDFLQEKIDELQEEVDELENEQNQGEEIFQWFIIDNAGVDILKEAGEIVYYNETLDIYLWGVTHWGTSWDYVLTDIPLNCNN